MVMLDPDLRDEPKTVCSYVFLSQTLKIDADLAVGWPNAT